MLPRLDRLSLARTGGYYELTDAEQQQVEDDDVVDPVSFERPTHVMTFRVQMDAPNPDGTPRYKYYSPASLWDWVKHASSQGKLPHNPSQKILYDDWMALYFSDPNRRNVATPNWVGFLEREHTFLQRMATLENAIKQRLRQEEEERGRIREQKNNARALVQNCPTTEVVIAWRYWIKTPWYAESYRLGAAKAATAKLRKLYTMLRHDDAELKRTLWEEQVASADGDAIVFVTETVKLPEAVTQGSPDGVVSTAFFVRMRKAAAKHFVTWAHRVIDRYGYEDFIARAHHQSHGWGGLAVRCGTDFPRILEDGQDPLVSLCDMPRHSDPAWFGNLKKSLQYQQDLDEKRSFPWDPTWMDYEFPPPPVVKVRWWFWVKMVLPPPPSRERDVWQARLKAKFVKYITESTNLRVGKRKTPWSDLQVNSDVHQLVSADDAESKFEVTVCRFVMYMREPEADAFIRWFDKRNGEYFAEMHPATGPALELGPTASERVYQDLFGVPVAVARDAHRPAILEEPPWFVGGYGERPAFTKEQFTRWGLTEPEIARLNRIREHEELFGTDSDEEPPADTTNKRPRTGSEVMAPRPARRRRPVSLELDEDDYALVQEHTGVDMRPSSNA